MNDIPQGLMTGRVIAKTDWTDRLFSLTVQVPELPFIAGQFTKLALVNKKGEWLRRAYSMVNIPNVSQVDGESVTQLEFIIITVPDGHLSLDLNHLKIGDCVYVGKTPSGFMTLNEVPDYAHDLWLLSTGTAIGPFLSIIAKLIAQPELAIQFEHIVLVHAVRQQDELIYPQRIQQAVLQLAGKLRYVPIVSRQEVPHVLQGRIPQLLQTQQLSDKAFVPLHPEHSFFYLCGNPEMVRDTMETLKQLGYRKHLRREAGHFSHENYW